VSGKPQGKPKSKPRSGLAEFNRHKGALLDQLRNECRRTGKPFDSDRAWRDLKLIARSYLNREAAAPITATRRRHITAELRQLEQTLGKAAHKLNETWRHGSRDFLFAEWCKTHGDPYWNDPRIVLYERGFDDMVATTLKNLTELKTNSSHAAKQLRRKSGRPRGGVLQGDFLNSLESTYRNSTGERGGTGVGPFSRFAVEFFAALGHEVAEQTVSTAFKTIRKKPLDWG